MAEISILTKINWTKTMLSMEVGEKQTFNKKYFRLLSAARIAATRLRERGKWSVSADLEALTFTVTRKK